MIRTKDLVSFLTYLYIYEEDSGEYSDQEATEYKDEIVARLKELDELKSGQE